MPSPTISSGHRRLQFAFAKNTWGTQGVPQKFVELRTTSPKPKTKLERSCDLVVHVKVGNYKWQGCVCKRNTWTKYTSKQCWLSTRLLMIIMIFASMNHWWMNFWMLPYNLPDCHYEVSVSEVKTFPNVRRVVMSSCTVELFRWLAGLKREYRESRCDVNI